MFALALAILPIFALLALGYMLARRHFPGGDFWPLADRLVYWLLFPALLFHETARAPVFDGTIGAYAWTLLGALIVAGLFALLVVRLTGIPGPAAGSVFQGAVRHNTFIAFAISEALFGPEGKAQAALATAILVPVTNLACVAVLVWLHHESKAGLWRRLGVELLRNPFLIAIAAGLGLNISGIGPLPVVDEIAGILSKAALPLALACVGAALRIETLRIVRWPLLASSLGKLAVFPAAVFVLLWIGGLSGLPALVAIVYGAVPTAVSGFALARQLGGDSRLMAAIITIETLAAILVTPLIIATGIAWLG